MKFKVVWDKKSIGPAVGLLLTLGTAFLVGERRLAPGLKIHSYDLLMVARGEIPAPEAVMVYLDEASYQNLAQPLNTPFDRSLHAKLVDRLTKAGARAIVFDIVFSDPFPGDKGPAIDAEFARAIGESGRVILAADLISVGNTENQVVLPIESLLTNAAGIGYAEMEASGDLVVRQHPAVAPSWCPTLSWAAADYLKAPATQQSPGTDGKWINYYGGVNFFSWARYYEALDPARIDDSFFSNKVVFVGARLQTKFAHERKDEYSSPFSLLIDDKLKEERGNRFMAGAEIQATLFLNLLRGDWMRRLPVGAERALLITIGLLFGFGMARLRPLTALWVGLAGMAVIYGGSYVLFRHQLTWWPWLIAEVQIGLALVWSITFNSIQLYVQKQLLEQTLRFYLPPKLVKKVARDPKMLQPGAEKQMLTILFSDIANFTTISEGLDSNELARMMNAYFQTAVSHCIHKTDGTVVKYIGDAIFAFWNAPEDQSDHAIRACQAALHFRDQEVQHINGHPLHTRIGLHTGVANVGNFGSTERVDYTALGENINLASRMEGLNKHLGTTLLVTGETKDGLGDNFVLRHLGLFRLKGFEKSVEVYELLGGAADAEKSRGLREMFAEALQAYQGKDFSKAIRLFETILTIRSDDGPSKFYLARLEELSHEPLPTNWRGEIELKEK